MNDYELEAIGDFEDFAGLGEASFEDFEDLEDEEMMFESGWDGEDDWESDYEADEIAEMEYLAEAAFNAETDEEADAFIGSLIGAATSLLPKAISIGKKVLPGLIKGARRLFRRARRSPAGRQVARVAPRIIRGTVRQTLRRASRGMPVNGRTVMRDFARQTGRVWRNPARRRAAVRHHCNMLRRARRSSYSPRWRYAS